MTGQAISPWSREAPEEVPLVDVLDRLLDKGAVVSGDLVLSIADVDLVWLGLQAVIGGIEHAPPGARPERTARGALTQATSAPPLSGARRPTSAAGRGSRRATPRSGAEQSGGRKPETSRRRVGIEEGRVEDGLVLLVLSVVDLLRQVMERQALRRVDDPSLSEERLEALGSTLMRLDERMAELRELFGIGEEELGLSLGLDASDLS